jgi:basic membrane protein A and related proteins
VRNTARVAVAGFGVAALILAGCGERDSGGASAGDDPSPTESATSEAPAQQYPDVKACMVSDSGGFNDKSFNQTSHDGMERAAEELGVQTAEVESNNENEFPDNINAMVREECNIVTAAGFLLADATAAAAKRNKDVHFSIVDFAYADDKGNNTAPPNVKGLLFDTAQPAYLAGYLAAGVSETGIVGTFGALPIPSVTAFMDGYQLGVEKYNEDNDADVQVIGWDRTTKKGSFTNDFEAKTKGQSTAEEMITQGADVIMPVAGPAGLGALQAAQDAEIKGIWVDTDGCVSAAEYCDVLLTSVMKAMDVAVFESIKASAEGSFDNTPYLGTLENGGVGLAPYHEQESAVPAELADRVEELKEQIISGELTIETS